MPTPALVKEAARLRTLSLYRILDSGAEKTFDDLTKLAAAICDTPIALISLVDEHRQWFKSRVGLDVTETSRDIAFCGHAIQSDDLFIVPDAFMDSRFSENPLVTSEPHIRFYAGSPLIVAGGERLGTLCVIDRIPKQLTEFQLNALQVLRHAVVTQLELKRSVSELHAVEKLLPMCAWCRDVKVSDNLWLPLHDYVMSQECVTHGICPTCSSRYDRPDPRKV